MRLTRTQFESELTSRLGASFQPGFVDLPDEAIKRLREVFSEVIKPADKPRGLGDTVERILRPLGGAKYKAWRKASGKPCNCDRRQEVLNRLVPYK